MTHSLIHFSLWKVDIHWQYHYFFKLLSPLLSIEEPELFLSYLFHFMMKGNSDFLFITVYKWTFSKSTYVTLSPSHSTMCHIYQGLWVHSVSYYWCKNESLIPITESISTVKLLLRYSDSRGLSSVSLLISCSWWSMCWQSQLAWIGYFCLLKPSRSISINTLSCTVDSRSVVPDSLQRHELEPVRLLCPWGFSGKNTGVGCHAMLQYSSSTLYWNQLKRIKMIASEKWESSEGDQL